jgi:hypothetical protein
MRMFRAALAVLIALWACFVTSIYLEMRRLSILLILTLTMLLGQEPSSSPSVSLDYAFFRDRVQPIFLAKRPGHARCVVCHDNGSPRLQELSPGATSWNEEQSRKNFEQWKNWVVPGNPMASPLLKHPLAANAGGDSFHAGGKHWKSQGDPEWQTLAAWVRGEKLSSRK